MKTTNSSIFQQLLSCGLRPTPQRVAVLTYLHGQKHKAHPSAESVYGALVAEYPTLSRTTVYQTLESLCKCGLIRKLAIDEGEMRFDAEMASNHGHFKCTQCGKIFDFFFPETTVLPQPTAEGFTVKETYLFHKGLCSKCHPVAPA